MTLDIRIVGEYLARYADAYRREYRRFVAAPPEGGGFPDLRVSPFLDASELVCYVTGNGTVLADLSSEPEHQWYIAGGPALMVDLPDTRTPPEVHQFLESNGLIGKPLGIYRLVSKGPIPSEVWEGKYGPPSSAYATSVDGTEIRVEAVPLDWEELIQRLTFGAFSLILDIKLSGPESPFWQPHVIRHMGFLTADRAHRRYFNYLELSPHVDGAAWDLRSIPTRVRNDLHRDFAQAFVLPRNGGSIQLGTPRYWPHHFHDRLAVLEDAIEEFERLLDQDPPPSEAAVHNFLQTHSILLDIYGEVTSKPRFIYPEGASPLEKSYVEPDFLVRYPGRAYRLIELERSDKRLGTVRGETRAELTQAAFQTSEWKTFIQNHYDRLSTSYPGIAGNCRFTLILGRATKYALGGDRDPDQYLQLAKNQLAVDEVLTYDHLLARAREAHGRLAGLSVPADGGSWDCV